jgi:CrcB protein
MYLSLTAGAINPDLRLLLATGIMGGFTTYSTFNYETLAFFQQGAWLLGALNVLATVFVCLAAGALGLMLSRWAFGQ